MNPTVVVERVVRRSDGSGFLQLVNFHDKAENSLPRLLLFDASPEDVGRLEGLTIDGIDQQVRLSSATADSRRFPPPSPADLPANNTPNASPDPIQRQAEPSRLISYGRGLCCVENMRIVQPVVN